MTLTAQRSVPEILRDCVSNSQSRQEFWVEFVRRIHAQTVAEIGVYQGDFAACLLQACNSIGKYYMIDPWRHLDDWNKPANVDDAIFDRFFETTRAKTSFAEARRVILRGKTTEVIDQIPDCSLDFAYIDGDHTLKGIAIDLIRVYPKIKPGGYVGGDDFTTSIWQHNANFEPTLVCPFAVYFAEAVGDAICSLPNSQFCMQKTDGEGFAFVDLTGRYRELSLRNQLSPGHCLRLWLTERFPKLIQFAGKSKRLISRQR